jgi:hypothetical protein
LCAARPLADTTALDELAHRARRIELEHLIRRRREAADALQVHDGLGDAGEHETVSGTQELVRSGCGHDVAAAVDLHQVQAVEPAQPRILDRLARERTVLVDDHLDGIFARALQLLDDGRARRQQPARKREHVQDADDRARHADPGELEQAETARSRMLQELALHDEIRAHADQRAGAAEDGRVAQGEHELRG